MAYKAQSADILFALRYLTGVKNQENEQESAISDDLLETLVEEAGNFAQGVIAPLNAQGDREGAKLDTGIVTMPKGWREAYKNWADAGWNGIRAKEAYGGQELPQVVWAAATELWNTASMAFGINPVLAQGATEALEDHASDQLKNLYLPPLVAGTWTATMNLTEPQAGSDLGAITTKAKPQQDGTYRLFGQKIFITYGEHDLTENIIHLVLARIEGAQGGTKGLSLFLVPKFLVNADGTLGARNDVVCSGIEHKLGIHASPTCTMQFGEKEGAIGYLVGGENRGMAAMFTMMNSARLAVGLQGVGIAERAMQQGFAYAHSREQGGKPIAAYPDVQRMLLQMKSAVWAARALCYQTAFALDRSKQAATPQERQQAHDRASLLTPLAKIFATDAGTDVASLNIQLHGGMGYVEETGAAQHYRDARIAAIYEGTNGIQAIDLVMRKVPLSQNVAIRQHLLELSRVPYELAAVNDPRWDGLALRLSHSVRQFEEVTDWLMSDKRKPEEKLASAASYARLYALVVAGCALTKGAFLSADDEAYRIARYFIMHQVSAHSGLADTIMEGAESILDNNN